MGIFVVGLIAFKQRGVKSICRQLEICVSDFRIQERDPVFDINTER